MSGTSTVRGSQEKTEDYGSIATSASNIRSCVKRFVRILLCSIESRVFCPSPCILETVVYNPADTVRHIPLPCMMIVTGCLDRPCRYFIRHIMYRVPRSMVPILDRHRMYRHTISETRSGGPRYRRRPAELFSIEPRIVETWVSTEPLRYYNGSHIFFRRGEFANAHP